MSGMQQLCTVCKETDKFEFRVRDDIREAVVPSEYRPGHICLSCFDDFAHQRNVNYAAALQELYFTGGKATFVFKPTNRRCLSRGRWQPSKEA